MCPDPRDDMTFRIDRQPDGLMEPERREDGTLFVHARVARPGIYEYREDGETVRELVPREELYDPKSLKSLGRVPYTDGHPGEPVEPENVSDHQAGDVGDEVEVDDQGFVKVKIAVRQKDAIRNVLDETKEETSPGYHCDALEESGEHPEFGEFDRIQTNRRYNHVAGVEKARGGPEIRMRTDSADHTLRTPGMGHSCLDKRSDRGDAYVSISGLPPGAQRCHRLWRFGIDRRDRRRDAQTVPRGRPTSGGWQPLLNRFDLQARGHRMRVSPPS